MPRWSRFTPAADRRLAKGLHDGDEDALATLYDVYAERLFDYSMALVDDPRIAADIVHDTFIDAARRAPRLRDRAQLRPWLYAAARRRCLQRKHQAEPARDDPLSRLDFLQREALFLALRHDVTGEDLALILGISPRRAEARLNRADDRVPDAADFLDTAPAPVVPATLRHRVQHTGTDPELAGYRVEIASRGGVLTAEGMPRQPDAPSRLTRRWAFSGAALIASTATVILAVLLIGPNLPVPHIQWPGGRPHPTDRPGSHHHRSNGAPPDGVPGNAGGGVQPSTGPELLQPSGTPTGSPPPPRTSAGRLAVNPQAIHFRGREKAADLVLSSKGGRLSWVAVASTPQLALSRSQGILKDKGRVTIQVMLDRGLLTLPGTATITVTDNLGHAFPVDVAWDTSLL
jgi:DNA-directed RNA polymerase specialized sigma24 family protein